MSSKTSVQSEESRKLRTVYGACPHDCPDCCALETHVDEQGQAVTVRGRSDHPVTRGWLCAKVNRYLERVYHPERLLYPMHRVGPKGSGMFERISWDEAIAEITSRWRDIIAHHGAQSLLPYSYAGTLGLVNNSVANSRFWKRLGASQLARTICGAAAEEAVILTVGARLAPSPQMLVQSKLILIWGSNRQYRASSYALFTRSSTQGYTHHRN
jgi:anaerobic selenocysteine-containing dehydrogenase